MSAVPLGAEKLGLGRGWMPLAAFSATAPQVVVPHRPGWARHSWGTTSPVVVAEKEATTALESRPLSLATRTRAGLSGRPSF